ncbi:MAG: DUF6115 domain-containing protein [bacterium]|nr:DUF6115 domain-containing protein [bacterium]
MGALEITLIVVGLVIIAASYYISEKGASSEETVKKLETVEDYEARKQVEKDAKQRLETMAEEVYAATDASLCKLSNEKIMAVNEYGDMVIDRIDKNHSEVVFLYSMLTDKEKELKELISMQNGVNPEQMKAKLDQIEDEMVNTLDQSKTDDLVENLSVGLEHSQAKVLHETKVAPDDKQEDQRNERHEQILSLYRSGKSVREISKELDLGQGEVQLVVNVYTGGN